MVKYILLSFMSVCCKNNKAHNYYSSWYFFSLLLCWVFSESQDWIFTAYTVCFEILSYQLSRISCDWSLFSTPLWPKGDRFIMNERCCIPRVILLVSCIP